MKRAIITISFCLVAIITMAQNAGDLDLSFSGDGKTTINIASGTDESYASAIQPDQKIILVGKAVTGQNSDIALARLNTDGQLDSSFGSGGKVVSNFGSNYEYAKSVAIQSDNKIVVGGFIRNSWNYDFALIRYLPEGTLDNTFGTGGKVQTDLVYDDYIYDIAIQQDGKILAVGYAVNISGQGDIAIVRYNSDGTLDNTFGTGGIVLTAIGSYSDFGYCIAIQSDGKFFVSGYYVINGNNHDVFVAKYNSDGTLDSSFGNNGLTLLDIAGGKDEIYSIAIQQDDKIVLGGFTRVGSNDFDLLLIRLNANGYFDTQFGNSGKIIKPISDEDDYVRSVNVQADGKIIAAGSYYYNYFNGDLDFFICRFNQDSSDDLTFGLNGTVLSPIGSSVDAAYSSLLQDDEKILVAGTSFLNGNMEFAIARYHSQCVLPEQPSEIYGNQTPCEGGSETYNVTNVSGVDYSWILPGDWNIISGQGTNAISVNVGQLSGDIQVTPSTTCGNGPTQTLVTAVEFIPDQPSSISGITEPCVGISQIYSVTNISGINYTWTIPNGSTITSGQGTNSITINIGPNSGDIQVVPSNICGNGPFSTLLITPQTTPAQPSAISGVSSACENTTNLSYSVSNINGVSYLWEVPNDWTIVSGQGTNSIITNAGVISGNITVTPSNICGDGIASSLSVNLSAVPSQPGNITGDDNVCSGTDQYYSVTAVSGVSYFWSVPAGWTITSGQNSNSISTTTGSTGTVSVTPSNNCGNGISSILEVTVNLLSVDAGSDQTITNGSSTTLYGNANSGSGNYSWLWSPIELLENPNIQNPNTLALGSSTIFTLTVTDEATACYETDQMIVTVTGGALSVVATAIPQDICIGDNTQLNALASNGSGNYSYSWTSLPQGFTSNLPNPIASPIITTDYIIEVNDGNSTVTDSITVEVSDIPEQPTKPDGPDTVDLHFTSFTSYFTTTTAGASGYFWEITPPEIANLNPNGLEVTLIWQGIGEASLKVYAINECGIVASDSLAIHVDNSVSISQIPFLIEVHPNPTKDFLLITFTGLQIKHINIANMTGLSVIPTVNIENQSEEYNLNLQSLSKGIYFIYLTTNKGIIVKKIIKI